VNEIANRDEVFGPSFQKCYEICQEQIKHRFEKYAKKLDQQGDIGVSLTG